MPTNVTNTPWRKQTKAWNNLERTTKATKVRSVSADTLRASFSYEENGELSPTDELNTEYNEQTYRDGYGENPSFLRQQLPHAESIVDSTCASNKRLHAVAAEAASSVNWTELDLELSAASLSGKNEGAWKRKKLPRGNKTSNSLDLYTRLTIRDHRHQTRWGPKGFAVLAEGSLPCSVQELRLALRVASTDSFRDIMRCIYRRRFVEGELLRTINIQRETGNPARAFDDRELSIKTATFQSSRIFSKKESWCFLELLQARDRSKDEQSITRIVSSTASNASASPPPAFTRTLVTIARSSAVPNDNYATSKSSRQQNVPNVIINYSFEEDPSSHSTRVVIHGEYLPPDTHDAYKRARHERRLARLWMLRLAANCHRLLLVIRRRRLGMQVTISDTRLPLDEIANVPRCACCRRSFARCFTRLRRRLCCLCGFLVCEKCAHAQEREHRARNHYRSRIERVQVCERCLIRVDQAKYTAITEEDLRPARVIPDSESPTFHRNSTPSGNRGGRYIHTSRKTRSASLHDLLLDILADASAGGESQLKRRASVVSVMRDIFDEERNRERLSATKTRNALAGGTRNIVPMLEDCEDTVNGEDYTRGKDVELYKRTSKDTESNYPLANAESRSYQINFPDDPDKAIMPPIPPSEHKRLQLIREQQLNELGGVPELEIICSVASKELGCAASMITVVEEATLYVLASNHPAVPEGVSYPREQGFCAQAILDTNPLVSRHVMADVRFSAMTIVRAMGINFYCGFPLVGPDGKTVIGVMCCVDQQARDLTQSQYDLMKSLACTASRVVRRAAEQRAVRESSTDE